MDAIKLYIRELAEKNLVPKEDRFMFDDTKVYDLDLEGNTVTIYFMTEIARNRPHVCQYVVYRDGKMYFRQDRPWFVPGDILFRTWEDIKAYIMGLDS